MKSIAVKNKITKLTKTLSYVPVLNWILIFLYAWAKRSLRNKLTSLEHIQDIIIISDQSSGQFIFGQSDYNLLIISSDTIHLKSSLKSIRAIIKSNPLTNLVFDSSYLPILTEAEFNTTILKSYVLKNYSHKMVTWDSLLTHKHYMLKPELTAPFPLIYFSMQDLDRFLFRKNKEKSKRTHIKNIYKALVTLNHFHPEQFNITSGYISKAKYLIRYSLLANVFYASFEKMTWQLFQKKSEHKVSNQVLSQSLPLPTKLYQYLQKCNELPFIQDVLITPALIQNDPETIQGKIFVEFLVNPELKNIAIYNLKTKFKNEIKEFQSQGLKIRFRVMSKFIYDFKNHHYLYNFPLEPLYRDHNTVSLSDNLFQMGHDKTRIHLSIKHFFITQVMRFRSLEQKTDLIGSKFIKSLNLMFRYYQIWQYLKTDELYIEHSEQKIREHLTPQFNHIENLDTLAPEDWAIVKQQLLYFLKKIREELVKYDPSLEKIQL